MKFHLFCPPVHSPKAAPRSLRPSHLLPIHVRLGGLTPLWVGLLLLGWFAPASHAAPATHPAKRAKAPQAPKARHAPKAKKNPHVLGQAQLMPLLQQLQKRDPQVRIAALKQLAAYKGKAQVVLVALARSLVDHNQAARFLAARQIIRWGPSALAHMRPALGHKLKKVRWSAAYALSQIRPQTPAIRSVQLFLLRNTSYRARGVAIQGLHQGKRVTERVWKALARQVAWDIHPINRIYCLHALVTHPRRALPILLQVMAKDKHPLVRRRAATLLVGTKLPKAPIVLALQKGLAHDSDDVVKLELLKLWGHLYARKQAPVKPMLPLLKKLANAKLWTLREATLVEIGRLGVAGRSLLPVVLAHLQDPRPEVQAAARQALGPLQRATTQPTSRPTGR